MLQPNKLKIMELFFEEPARVFQLREISRLTNIAATSTKKYLKELTKNALVQKQKGAIYPGYTANETNPMYKTYKQAIMLINLHKSGLISYLEKETLAPCIILFGSIRKGEYTKKSDIDLFIQSTEQKLALDKYEKNLKHKISIIFEPRLQELSEELLNNITNGIVLSGYLKIRRELWQRK